MSTPTNPNPCGQYLNDTSSPSSSRYKYRNAEEKPQSHYAKHIKKTYLDSN
jgi:hypothetical protein